MKPHEILGVPPGAPLADAKAAYRRLAMQYHPDRCGGDNTKFLRIQQAWEAFERAAEASPFTDIIKDIARRAKQ